MGVQTAVSVLVLIAAVVIRYAGIPWYAAARGQAAAVVNKTITVSDVKQTLAEIGSKLKLESSPQSSAVSGSAQAVTDSDSAEPIVSTPSAVSTRSGAGSSPESAKSVSQTKNAKSNSVKSSAASQPTDAEGGEDIASPDGTTALPTAAPSGASFAPVRLSLMPVLPVHGRLTSRFGWRVNPITKKISFHTGVDIAVAEGTPLAAALPGVVSESGVSEAYGNYVIMDNGGGVTTFYGHCQAILAPKGTVLRAGDIVAKSGNTGWSTGPHLHFELRVRNIRTNPIWVLKLDEKQNTSPAH